MKGQFISVGENIHCTRIRLTSGKWVATTPEGRPALVFKTGGERQLLAIPEAVVKGEEWSNGKVRHVAVAVRQGLHGTAGEQETAIAYLQSMARDQAAQGAHFLDLNVDEYSQDLDEKRRAMVWLTEVVQRACDLPMSLDSSTPELLEAGLGACDRQRGKPLLNSVSLERAGLIGLAAEQGAKVIASATGATAMPESVAERLANLEALTELLRQAGLGEADTYYDPLVFPIAVDATNGLKVIDTICALREKLGAGIHFAPGLSNVSYGLPKRPLINQVFTYLCHAHGCDGGIVDPAQINDGVLAAIDPDAPSYKLACALLCGQDEYGMDYITAAREGRLDDSPLSKVP